ncbi:MAG: hypothetical protein ABI867_36970 [Kofleriaceae bacterium]
MRSRRLLLATAALSSSLACKKERPLPGNPKGSMYVDAGPITPNLPANPKGSNYDDDAPRPTPIDAGVDAPVPKQKH